MQEIGSMQMPWQEDKSQNLVGLNPGGGKIFLFQHLRQILLSCRIFVGVNVLKNKSLLYLETSIVSS